MQATWTRCNHHHLLLGGIFIVKTVVGWWRGATSFKPRMEVRPGTSHACLKQPEFVRSRNFICDNLGWAVGSGGNVTVRQWWATWQQELRHRAIFLTLSFLTQGWAVGAEGTIIYTNDGGCWTQSRQYSASTRAIFFADQTRWLGRRFQWDHRGLCCDQAQGKQIVSR